MDPSIEETLSELASAPDTNAGSTTPTATGFNFTPNLNYSQGLNSGYQVLDAVHPSVLWLKDRIAEGNNQKALLKDMFGPDNALLSTDQYVNKANQSLQPLPQNTATLDDSQYLQNLDAERQINSQMPMTPTQAPLTQPNTAQTIAAILGALAAPEFAMQTASQPFAYGLQEQDKQQALNNLAFQQRVKQLANQLAIQEQQTQGQRQGDVLRYQTGNADQENAIDRTFKSNLQQQGFSNDLQMLGLKFKHDYDLATLDQKQRLAMSMLHTVESGDPAQAPWAGEILKSLGYNLPAMVGKPLQEQAQEIALQTAKSQEAFNQKMRPLELQGKRFQNLLLGKEYAWFDKKAQAQYAEAMASIRNIDSLIGDRKFQQGVTLRGEDRQNLSLAGSFIERGMSAVQSELKSADDDIQATLKQLDPKTGLPLSDAQRTALEDHLADLRDRRGKAASALDEIRTDYDSIKNVTQSNAGVTPGPTNLGESFLGVPYKWGGTTSKGLDCSGLTCQVARQDYGVNIPRTAKEQFSKLAPVEPKDATTGDFIYWSNKGNTEWHTGILLQKEDGWYVRNAPHTGAVVRDEKLNGFEKNHGDKIFRGFRRAWKPQATTPQLPWSLPPAFDPSNPFKMGG